MYSPIGDEDALKLLFSTAKPLFDCKVAFNDYKARVLQMNSRESSVTAPSSLKENPRLESSNLEKVEQTDENYQPETLQRLDKKQKSERPQLVGESHNFTRLSDKKSKHKTLR